jgi:hypothetical protein
MADHLPKFAPGTAVTMTASAAVTGGQLTVFTGNRRVGPAGAGAAIAGVAGRDALAEQQVVVHRGAGHVLLAETAIAAGGRVMAGATGQVAAWAPIAPATVAAPENIIGVAAEAIAAGARGLVFLTES